MSNTFINDARYEQCVVWIKHKIEKNVPIEKIKFLMSTDKLTEESLQEKLNDRVDTDEWPKLDTDTWLKIVDEMFEKSNEKKNLEKSYSASTIARPGEENDTKIPSAETSTWQKYKNKLIKNGFSEKDIAHIEIDVFNGILKKLSSKTDKCEAIKGLVVGSVQSGKTAIMAGLISLAADNSFNLFIILSGTLEQLRQQTLTRLKNDLTIDGGHFSWHVIPEGQYSNISGESSNLNFANTHDRYYTVCLKNSSRLRNLIKWLQRDTKIISNMKIIVIDDEADNASINTSKKQEADEVTKINELIRNLVNCRNESGMDVKGSYGAMNYVGFTATPYANLLNESGVDTLYPKDFITSLSNSDHYLGPQQIFGYNNALNDTYSENIDYSGLNIIRRIDSKDVKTIKMIHNENEKKIPKSLENSLYWFCCCVACQRYLKYEKPISMLIHTSYKIKSHKNLYLVINDWFKKLLDTSENERMENCRKIWEEEINILSKENFKQQLPKYDLEIKDYPNFEEIKEFLNDLFNISYIELYSKEDEPKFGKGIHICVENSDSDKPLRLIYPKKNCSTCYAPAFIVIGGNSLSRGLTLEGLVCSYFLRASGQADTLMQMGRWFGYRASYELLPRIWMTENTEKQFKFLAELDMDLRLEIKHMILEQRTPDQYGARLKNSPKLSFLGITSKNKQKDAGPAEYNYEGQIMQTHLFDNNNDIISSNINYTKDFLNSLGEPCDSNNSECKNTIVWKNIEFSRILCFLKKYKFNERLVLLNTNVSGILYDWIEKMTSKGVLFNWNVVLAGKEDQQNGILKFGNYKINKVKRSVVKPIKSDNSYFSIKTLRSPHDILADIDLSSGSILKKVKSIDVLKTRNECGLNSVPQLLIYIIDKEHINNNESNIKVNDDIAGLCIVIPGDVCNTKAIGKISLKPKYPVIDEDGDINE